MLRGRALSFFQNWALSYWLYMQRRQQLDDMEAQLENQCFHLFPERWGALYQQQPQIGDLGQAFGGEEELPVTDVDDLDRWYQNLENSRRISGATAMGIADGPGRRV